MKHRKPTQRKERRTRREGDESTREGDAVNDEDKANLWLREERWLHLVCATARFFDACQST